MPYDARYARLDALAKDAAAIDQIGTRIAGLVGFIRHAAKDASGHQTSDALEALAQALCDTAHDAWGDAVEMHARDCDEEGAEPCYVIDPVLAVTFCLETDATSTIDLVGLE